MRLPLKLALFVALVSGASIVCLGQQGGGPGGGTSIPAPTGASQCFVSTASGQGHWTWGSCSGSSSLAFSSLTTGTNTAATMTIGSGATFNATGTANIDWSSVAPARFKLPLLAGATTSANGNVAYDLTNLNWHIYANGADNFLFTGPSAGTFNDGDCAKFHLSGSTLTLIDNGSPCSGGTGITVNGGSTLTNPVNFQNGSAVDGLTINASNPSGSNVQFALSGTYAGAVAATTLSASSTVSGTGFSTYLASPPAIGGTAAAAGSFTNLSSSGTVSGTGFSTYLASPPAIGGTAAAAGSFTNLSSSGTVSGTGFSTYLASPPAIGGTAPAAGAFTTLSATSTVSGAGITSLFASPPAIGGTAAAGGAFTTLSASSTVSGTGFTNLFASPPPIGTTAANTVNGTNLGLPSGGVAAWNSDTGFSRTGAAAVAVGNGTNGDTSGTITAANVNANTSVGIGGGASTVLGTRTTGLGLACGTGSMTQTAGYAGLACDSGTGKWVMILPSGAEYVPPINAAIVPQAAGGTGINNTATLTLGSSNVNLASQASGVVYNTTTTGALTPATAHQIWAPELCNDTSSSSTTFTCTTSPSFGAVAKGDVVNFCSINQNNSGASTLAVNGGSAIAIKKWQSTALVSGDLQANACVLLRYDGTNFEVDTIGNAPGGTGTVTVVGGGSLTSTALVTGGGTTTLQTPSTTSTLDASGNLAVAAGGSVGSADTGTPKFTFATNKVTVNQPFYFGTTSNQAVFGTTTNLTTLTFPAPSGGVTLTFPITSQYMLGGNADTTTTHVLHASAVNGVGSFSAIAAGDLPGGAGQILAGSTPALTATPALGTDNSVAGTLQLANGSANAHTIWGSGATTTNTIQGFAAVPTTGHLVDCTVTSTTCLLHDSGVVTANVVNASSPGVGIAHFAGSTQTVTSSLIVAADITSSTITGTQIASSIALAGSPTTTSQSQGDNSTKIATTAYVDANTTVCNPGSFTAQTDGATVTWAIASNKCANAALTFTVHSGSRTLNLTGLVTGGSYVIKLIQDGTGGENLTGGTGCTWKQTGGGGSTFTLTATASAIDVLSFVYDGTNCLAVLTKAYS